MKTSISPLQLDGQIFLTDGGLETDLIFNEGIDLPSFAAFVLLEHDEGLAVLSKYYNKFLAIAEDAGSGFILESPTWRANLSWGRLLGYDESSLDVLNRRAIELMHDIKKQAQSFPSSIVISGCMGPRGDGYFAGERMSASEAHEFHRFQTRSFSRSGVDLVSAMTMTYSEEAIGICRAAQEYDLPVVISFTCETDGRLPSGQSLAEAIDLVDRETENGPAYYMINCAHPEHFDDSLARGEAWTQRIKGFRANASRLSHAELDEADVLDEGDPNEFGLLYRKLQRAFPHFTVFGGCCGTDHRHLEAVSECCSSAGPATGPLGLQAA